MRSHPIAVMLLGLVLAACATTPAQKAEKANKAEVARVLNRTITETQVQKVEVPMYMKLPEYLLTPCPVTHAADRSINEYIRVAIENTSNLEKCANQIQGITKLQPER